MDPDHGDRFAPWSGTRYFVQSGPVAYMPGTLHRILRDDTGMDFEYWNGNEWEFSPLLIDNRVNGGTDFTEVDAAEAARFLGASFSALKL